MKKTILIAAALTMMVSAAAQPGGERNANSGEKRQQKELTVQEEAQLKLDQMSRELTLTNKQEKKLLSFYKNDIQYRRNNFGGGSRPDFGGERPQGAPQGMHQGGSQGGQRPSGGMGPGGSRDGFHGGGQGMGSQEGRPQMNGGDVDFEKIEKYNQKQEKKLKKILGEAKYNQWRNRHPAEQQKLPDLELR